MTAILLMGPTATGKSALAVALAEAIDGEIVTVDSAQVYLGMDIGTAKPDPATRARVPHHLIDLIEPTQSYSAARFCHDATEAMAAIRMRGKLPILAGGTNKLKAPFGYGLVSCSFTAGERVRVPHGVPTVR